MELVLILALLYALEGTRLLPTGAAVFGLRRSLGRVQDGPGWRIPGLLPAAYASAARLPVVERGAALGALSGVSRFGLGSDPGAGPDLPVGSEVACRGKVVMVGGRPFARGVTKRHAGALADLVRDLGEQSVDAGRNAVARVLGDSLDVERYSAERERFGAATRALAWLSSADFVALFALLPAAMLSLHTERGILVWLPIGSLLHCATWAALLVAHRTLAPDARAERFELSISTALYPPALLHGLQKLWDDACSVFHPALLASVLLDGEARRARLRLELARVEHAPDGLNRGPLGIGALEREALLRFLARIGEDPEALRSPPPQRDPLAASYCPVCLCDYRGGATRCSDCDTALRAYRKA